MGRVGRQGGHKARGRCPIKMFLSFIIKQSGAPLPEVGAPMARYVQPAPTVRLAGGGARGLPLSTPGCPPPSKRGAPPPTNGGADALRWEGGMQG